MTVKTNKLKSLEITVEFDVREVCVMVGTGRVHKTLFSSLFLYSYLRVAPRLSTVHTNPARRKNYFTTLQPPPYRNLSLAFSTRIKHSIIILIYRLLISFRSRNVYLIKVWRRVYISFSSSRFSKTCCN